MRIIDLFCGAGGASKGYVEAGHTIIAGVDLYKQKNYPYNFIGADWREGINLARQLVKKGLDVGIHASPPCQRYSNLTKQTGKPEDHPDLVGPVRDELLKLNNEFGIEYVIENVVGAPIYTTIMLCGSMFGLKVRRHRLFEASFDIPKLRCEHKAQGKVVGVYGHAGGSSKRDGQFHSTQDWKAAMGIDWMTGKELAESIPPAYTKYIGQFWPADGIVRRKAEIAKKHEAHWNKFYNVIS